MGKERYDGSNHNNYGDHLQDSVKKYPCHYFKLSLLNTTDHFITITGSHLVHVVTKMLKKEILHFRFKLAPKQRDLQLRTSTSQFV